VAARITIQYVPGCPHRGLAADRVRQALDRLGTSTPSVELCAVRDEAEAHRLGFRGSPTVLVDGVDPFAEPGAPVGVACRVYATPAGPEGAPSVEQLKDALR
jgi:hypothetical protein